MGSKHPSAERLRTVFFDDGPAARERGRLKAHLDGCPACQERYHKLARAQRYLLNPDRDAASPSDLELASIGRAVVSEATNRGRRRARGWRLALGLAPAAALATALLLVLVPEPPEFQAKGGVSELSRLQLSAYCIDPVSEEVVELGVSKSCSLGHLLQLTYRLRGEDAFLFLFGRQQGRTLWYQPAPPDLESIKVQASESEELVPGAIRLEINHQTGPLCLYGLATREVLDGAEIAKSSEESLQQLAGGDGAVGSFCFDVSP